MSEALRTSIGLPIRTLILLALLGAPRVVLHDLGVIQEGTFVNAILVAAPLVAWVLVVLRERVPNPFLALLAIGTIYGVVLAATHLMLWGHVWAGRPPTLGGNLRGVPGAVQALMMWVATAISSLFTGVAVGAVTGVVGWVLSKAAPTVDTRS